MASPRKRKEKCIKKKSYSKYWTGDLFWYALIYRSTLCPFADFGLADNDFGRRGFAKGACSWKNRGEEKPIKRIKLSYLSSASHPKTMNDSTPVQLTGLWKPLTHNSFRSELVMWAIFYDFSLSVFGSGLKTQAI